MNVEWESQEIGWSQEAGTTREDAWLQPRDLRIGWEIGPLQSTIRNMAHRRRRRAGGVEEEGAGRDRAVGRAVVHRVLDHKELRTASVHADRAELLVHPIVRGKRGNQNLHRSHLENR